MEVESWVRALREHVREVAVALGVGESCWILTEEPVSVYLPLDDRFFGFPEHDAALLWDPRCGWYAVVDDAEPLVVAYLHELYPSPSAVVRFVRDLVAGRRAGFADPPCFSVPLESELQLVS
jgi:hypothetical protein